MSGFSGAGDFYSTTGYGNGSIVGNGGNVNGGQSVMMNNLQQLQQLQYRSPSQIDHISSSLPLIPSRRTELVPKRSLSEQQQAAYLRSVKQRSQYNHTSPISPLTPFDFSSGNTSVNNNNNNNNIYNNQNHLQFHQQLQGNSTFNPLVQQLRSLPINPSSNSNYNFNHINTTSSNSNNSVLFNPNQNLFNHPNHLSVSNSVPNRQPERDSENKMRNRLQELEKQLLEDEEGDASCDVTDSVVTSSEWSETMQNLLSPSPPTTQSQTIQSQNQSLNQKGPFSPSPTSSCSSSSSPSNCPSLVSSKQCLVDVATAISEGKTDVAVANLERLNQISNPRGDPEQRLTSYMVAALKSKINPAENPSPVTELARNEHIMATQMLYEASPCFKYAFLAANSAIMESLQEQPNNNIHIVDFDIGQGIQYMALLHGLGERKLEMPVFLKITTVTDTGKEGDLKIVGDRLRQLADRVGVVLNFNVVTANISSLNRELLHCEANEALVVNFALKLYKMPDESVSLENPRDELLRMVKGLGPQVVTMVEYEMNCNTAPFVARVGEVSSYYLALFNSLDSGLARDKVDRVKIEECLGRKAANSVACEGRERVERCEVFGKWRARMGMAGFVSRPMSQHVGEFVRGKLNLAYKNIGNPGFTIKEEAGGICFGWMGRVLTVASAWR